MNVKEFSLKLANIIQKYGFDSPTLNVFKQALKGTNDNNAFFSYIKSPSQFDIYVNLIENDDIKIRGVEDTEPIKCEDFWRRDKSDFIYTAKILPEIRDRYPEIYDTVFDGERILPAGLGGKDPEAKTIWNSVVEVEEGKNPKKKSGQNKKNLKSVTEINDKQLENQLKQSLPDAKNLNFTPEQLKAVRRFLGNTIADL